MSSLRRLWIVGAILAVGGCGPASPNNAPAITSTTEDALTANGSDLNGISLNGSSQNGSSQNGTSQNGSSQNGSSQNGSSQNGSSQNGPGLTVIGIEYAGMTLDDKPVSNVSLQTTQLVGTVGDQTLSGSDWVGVQVRANLTDGHAVNARITKVVSWQQVEGSSQNGPSINGSSQNGSSQNGSSQNGSSQNGSSQNGSSQNGSSQNGSSQNGEGLGGPHQAADAGPDSFVPGTPDMVAYEVEIETPYGHRALCGVDAAGNPIPAIPLAGRWDYRRHVVGGGSHIDDPSQFTFACVGAALAKCVELGYWPWLGADGAAHHQACTRMIRADYCGDGTPHTVDGMLINLYDDEGIQLDTEDWPFEAEWSSDGAVCVAHQRIFDTTHVHCSTPHTFAAQNTCGDLSHFQSGTLLMDEYAPTDQIR